MRRLQTKLLAVALVTALVLVACGDDETDQTSPPEDIGQDVTGNEPTGASSLADVEIKLEPVAELDAPVAFATRAGTTDLYIAEQPGRVRRIEVTERDGRVVHELDDTVVLDLTDATKRQGERGLLGIAFSPDGTKLYVDYTDLETVTRIVEYTMDGTRADPASARDLLTIQQPYPNHNGGQLVFGPDGFLYIAMGDGGSADDPENRAQNTQELLGKILRIDPANPTATDEYAVPADNPFVSGGGRPEIWLFGVRNPWRFSFDRETGDLWVADVGQEDVEEITWLPAEGGTAGRGANLGWVFKEGTRQFRGDPPEGLTDPIHEYDHSGNNCSITGGFVYRGSAIPGLRGAYLYGDYCTAEVWGLLAQRGEVLDDRSLGVEVPANSLSSFGEGTDGELYVLSTEGTVYRIEPA